MVRVPSNERLTPLALKSSPQAVACGRLAEVDLGVISAG